MKNFVDLKAGDKIYSSFEGNIKGHILRANPVLGINNAIKLLITKPISSNDQNSFDTEFLLFNKNTFISNDFYKITITTSFKIAVEVAKKYQKKQQEFAEIEYNDLEKLDESELFNS